LAAGLQGTTLDSLQGMSASVVDALMSLLLIHISASEPHSP